MNRHEEIGLDIAGFLYAYIEWNKIVGIARQHDTHVGLFVDFRLETFGDGSYDIFFFITAAIYFLLPLVWGIDLNVFPESLR